MKLKYITLCLFVFCSLFVSAQINSAGKPMFRNVNKNINTSRAKITRELKRLQVKSTSKNRLKISKYAKLIEMPEDILNNRNVVFEDDELIVFQHKIISKGAYSLGLNFSSFFMPKGASVFVYNYTNSVLGAYTSVNNKSTGNLVIQPLEGDYAVVECIVPKDEINNAKLFLTSILHDYVGVFAYLNKVKSSSGSCNININCSEGRDWQLEKKSVCSILMNGYLSSGAFINNTAFDGRALFLTAHHAIKTDLQASKAVFYFNDEKIRCYSDNTNESQTISGSSLLATSNDLDFALLELSIRPPSNYAVYFAGWDRSGIIPDTTTCIHHPSGDVKKISIDFDLPTAATYVDSDYSFMKNSSWLISRWDLGTTEGGSSGAPLFNQNHKIIGDLTGGEADCENSVNDYFAKFSYSWDYFSDIDKQLAHWLDPINSGLIVLDGYDPIFSVSKLSVCVGESLEVNYCDDNNINVLWDFGEGAVHTNVEGGGPHEIVYNTGGKKKILLEVITNTGSRFYNKYIEVAEPVSIDFKYDNIDLVFKNLSENAIDYIWSFGDGNNSIIKDPTYKYKFTGSFNVELSASNICNSESISKIINISFKENVQVFPNPTSGLFRAIFNHIGSEDIPWAVYSFSGAKIKDGFFNTNDYYIDIDIRQNSKGIYYLIFFVDGHRIQKKIVLQ